MIKREKITVRQNATTDQYYKSLGYEIPKERSESFEVWSTDIPVSSEAEITRVCDECGEEHKMRRVKYRPVCRKCVSPKINKARKDPSKTTCPKCGGPKAYSSKTCHDCMDTSGENNPMYGKPSPKTAARNRLRHGELSPLWKPELTDKDRIKNGRSGKQICWGKAVKDNWGWICDCCGYSRKLALEAHHYVAGETIQKDFDPANGVALCANCHKEFHKTYGYGRNSQAQYQTFKEAYHG